MTSKRALFITSFVLFVFLGSVGVVVFYNNFSPLFKASNGPVNGDSVIAKVGAENLYQKDLDYELSLHPQKDDPQTSETILQKMITDSIVLQGGAADNLITIDSTIFNSPTKDYGKRIEAVTTVKEGVLAKAEHTKGTVISIWFRNNDYIGPLGLEKSKQVAYGKISALQNQIASGKITIDQAGEMIIKDATLAQIDKAWTNNAIFHFDATGTDRISFSSQFDTILRDLKPGEVSEVYLARNVDVDPNKRYEALYYVGQVLSKTNSGNLSNFDTWLSQKRKLYEVTH